MDLIPQNEDVCLSGGADGADLEWGTCAGKLGHTVIHWSFPGHKTQASSDETIRLTDEQFDIGKEAIEKAAAALGKEAPSPRSHSARLIGRDYYQVAWSTSCYAVGRVQDGIVAGGTGWAVMMFSQLHPENRNLFLFDQEKNAWFQTNGKGWDLISTPPRPSGVWAGIGARDLKQNGRNAIRKLMDD